MALMMQKFLEMRLLGISVSGHVINFIYSILPLLFYMLGIQHTYKTTAVIEILDESQNVKWPSQN